METHTKVTMDWWSGGPTLLSSSPASQMLHRGGSDACHYVSFPNTQELGESPSATPASSNHYITSDRNFPLDIEVKTVLDQQGPAGSSLVFDLLNLEQTEAETMGTVLC